MEEKQTYDANQIIQFKCEGSRKIIIHSAKNLFPNMEIHLPVANYDAKLLGKWLVEFAGFEVLLRERNVDIADDCLSIILGSGNSVNIITALQDSHGGYTTSRHNNVIGIDIYSEELCFTEEEPERQEEPTIIPPPVHAEPDPNLVALQEAQETIIRLQQIVDSKLESLLDIAKQNEQALTGNQSNTLAEIGRLQKTKESASATLEDILANQNNLQTEINAIQEQIEIQLSKKEQLESELTELKSKKEFVDLDCEKAKGETEELRARIQANDETFSLLEEETILKHGSVTKTLENMEKEITAVENRIAKIIKFQTAYHTAIEDAIFHGDGTIPSIVEVGGK